MYLIICFTFTHGPMDISSILIIKVMYSIFVMGISDINH